MAQPRIVFEPYASGAQRQVVEEIINRRNVAITGHDQWYQVAFFVKTDDGEILGGLLGAIWAKRLSVGTLAVQEPFRGKGYGTELMKRAEQYATEPRMHRTRGSPRSTSRRGRSTSGWAIGCSARSRTTPRATRYFL
jgi:GNAT superfamily N-acetyltransferase